MPPHKCLFFILHVALMYVDKRDSNSLKTNSSTSKDALLVSLSERGQVDLDFTSALLHRSAAGFLPELTGVIFRNPQSNRWETEDEYFSGNVRAKLQAAEAAVLIDPQYQLNVEADKDTLVGCVSSPASKPAARICKLVSLLMAAAASAFAQAWVDQPSKRSPARI